MADADALKGFAKSEVRLLTRGDARVLVSRLLGRGGMVLLLAGLALLALVVPALDLRLDTVVLRCSREEAACTVAGGEAGGRTLPLASIHRFQARHPRKQKPDLLAQTDSGEVVLVHRWPHEELGAHADALNQLLGGAGPEAWSFTYARRFQALREDLPIFGSLFAILVVLALTQLGWRTRLERRRHRVVRWKPLARAARDLGSFRAVQVRSMAEAHPGAAAQSGPMAAMLAAQHQIALVDAGGAAWPITRFLTCPREEVEARAAEVANYLDLPLARPAPQPALAPTPPAPPVA